MPDSHRSVPEGEILQQMEQRQLQQLQSSDPRYRGMQLPEGLMLRYNLAHTLYFYLRTGLKDGKIATRVWASDSPYDRGKADIGEVLTPMMETDADQRHLANVQQLLRTWIRFVREKSDDDQDFTSFEVDVQPR